MGFLHYGADAFPMEDRQLVHLQIAVHEMMRQRSSFYVTWIRPVGEGSGRISILVSAGVHLTFVFEGGRVPRVNPAWVHELVARGLSGTGLIVTPEPSPDRPDLTGSPKA